MNLLEISEKFPTELDCIEYAEYLRWGDTNKCAYCGSDNLTKRWGRDYRHICKSCKKSTAVTVNTHLHNTRLKLKTWFYAISVITDAKKGMSALQLHRNIGVSYPTAFKMYHKLREVMSDFNNVPDELEGVVEMDETFIGGKPRKFNNGTTTPSKTRTIIPELDKRIKELKEEGFNLSRGKGNPAKSATNVKRGRGTDNIPVVGIVQRNGNVVAEVMKNLTYQNLKDMVQKYVVEDKSVLITDQYSGYNSMKKIIEHVKIDHERLYSYKGVNTNTIESFWAIVERGIMGQYHSVSPKMLPNYVAEFVYKYNNRNDTDSMFEEILKKLLNPIN